MVSKASEDLPEPDRPVNTTSWSRGMSTSTFFRLCSRAPRIAITRESGFLRSKRSVMMCSVQRVALLEPEFVHGDEGVGVVLLERVPVIKVGLGGIVREPFRVAPRRAGLGLEA